MSKYIIDVVNKDDLTANGKARYDVDNILLSLGYEKRNIHLEEIEGYGDLIKHVNIIYNELCVRGYSVDVGILEVFERNEVNNSVRKQIEVDFVVNRGSQRYYIQSAYALPSEEKIKQEERPLRAIPDYFKKIIVVKDDILPRRNEDGILILGLRQFLLDEQCILL